MPTGGQGRRAETRTPAAKLLFAVGLISLGFVAGSVGAGAEPSRQRGPASGTLTLTDGSRIAGELRPSDIDGVVRWQGADFIEPFELAVSAIRSIRFEAADGGNAVDSSSSRQSQWKVVLINRDTYLGRRSETAGDFIELETEHLGTVRLEPAVVRRVVPPEGQTWPGFDSTAEPTGDQPAHSRPAGLTLTLRDGTRCTGNLVGVDSQQLVLQSPILGRELAVPLEALQTYVGLLPASVKPVEGALGRMELDAGWLRGVAVPRPESDRASEGGDRGTAVAWHPLGSRNASSLRPGVSARVVLQRAAVATPAERLRREEIEQLRREARRKAAMRGAWQPATPSGQTPTGDADEAQSNAMPPSSHAIRLRGDQRVTGEVIELSPAMVRFDLRWGATVELPAKWIEAVELSRSAPGINLSASQRERLLTVPRLQADSPPTHLIGSDTGDWLRCRLLAVEPQVFRVALRRQEAELPRDRVAQLIWLVPPDDDQDLQAVPGDGPTGGETGRSSSCLVARDGGARLRLALESFDGRQLRGRHSWLGELEIPLSELDELVFGDLAGTHGNAPGEPRWQLHPAPEPRFAADGGESGSGAAGEP